MMFWSWLYAEGSELLAPVNRYLHRHVSVCFRALLFGGDLLFLAIFWPLQQIFSQQRTFGLWLAGFTATLAILLVFTMGSALLNGYRPDQDLWIRLATVIMLLFCFILMVSTLF